MGTTATETDGVRPVIHMIEEECDFIEGLAMAMEEKNPSVAGLLFEELDRAQLHSAADMPPHTVTMNSKVEFIDEGTGAQRVIELVYPKDADIAQGKISIFTPIGAGLIGMTAGENIAWPDRRGIERSLRIVSVTPPEKSSDPLP